MAKEARTLHPTRHAPHPTPTPHLSRTRALTLSLSHTHGLPLPLSLTNRHCAAVEAGSSEADEKSVEHWDGELSDGDSEVQTTKLVEHADDKLPDGEVERAEEAVDTALGFVKVILNPTP